MALALQAQGDHDESEQQLKKALELDDDLPATHVGLGRLYLETSRHAQARHHLQRAVSLLQARSERNSESDELLEMTRGLLEQAAATPQSRPDR